VRRRSARCGRSTGRSRHAVEVTTFRRCSLGRGRDRARRILGLRFRVRPNASCRRTRDGRDEAYRSRAELAGAGRFGGRSTTSTAATATMGFHSPPAGLPPVWGVGSPRSRSRARSSMPELNEISNGPRFSPATSRSRWRRRSSDAGRRRSSVVDPPRAGAPAGRFAGCTALQAPRHRLRVVQPGPPSRPT